MNSGDLTRIDEHIVDIANELRKLRKAMTTPVVLTVMIPITGGRSREELYEIHEGIKAEIDRVREEVENG